MSAMAARTVDRFQLFPPLSVNEMDALRRDIAERGVMVPVEMDEHGDILDGHHRAAIADELGIEYPTVVRKGMTEDEKLEHVFALNFARRSLSKDEQVMVMAECRRRGMSLRAIGDRMGVSAPTVMRHLASVSDVTPELEQPPEPEPIAPLPTLTDRIDELHATGATQRSIASALGVSEGTVSNLLHRRADRQAALYQPAEWPQTRSLVKELRTFAESDPRRVAAGVPDRNRASVARELRRVGTFLGSIALELERSERS